MDRDYVTLDSLATAPAAPIMNRQEADYRVARNIRGMRRSVRNWLLASVLFGALAIFSSYESRYDQRYEPVAEVATVAQVVTGAVAFTGALVTPVIAESYLRDPKRYMMSAYGSQLT